MKTVEFKVAGHVNYDAKMAGKIVTALSDVSSNVFIISANARVNAKSIIGVILVLVTNKIIKKTENEGIL